MALPESRIANSPAVPGRRSGRHELLLEIADVLTPRLDPELLFTTIAQVVRKTLNIDRASLALYDAERDEFVIAALALQENSQAGKGFAVPRLGSRAGKAFDERRPYLSRALGRGVAFVEDPPLMREGMRTGLTIPLFANGTCLGTFNVNCRRESALRLVDVDLLAKIADQIAIAVASSPDFRTIRRATAALQRESERLTDAADAGDGPDLLLRNCPSMRSILDRWIALAKVDATVLISGETGTGKGVLARALHSWSARRNAPFVKCDCAALAPSLIESELFGHERGSFTGAESRRVGRFELAHGGTIFLDEIAEMPLETQAKLLGVLEDRELRRVGGNRTIPVDLRVVAATNRDLEQEVRSGRFRRDLYFRLNVVELELKPLRDRREDILPLASFFVRRHARSLGRGEVRLGSAAPDALLAHPWPGNVRELGNVIERAMLFQPGSVLEIAPEVLGRPSAPLLCAALRERRLTLAEVEARHIREVLQETGWRIDGPEGAARILGLHPNTLRSRMAKRNVHRPRRPPA
jgi:formate hydrogenlyase transcriptional activator